MQTLQDMLYHRHPGVQMYKQAYELTQNMAPQQQCNIALCYDRLCDRHCYNLPTEAASNELAIILPGDGDQFDRGPDIFLNRHSGTPWVRISDINPFYLPLHYVLLHPTGQPGWHPRIPYNRGEQVNDGNGQKRKHVSQSEYFCYRLHPRENESNHIFTGGKLLQEYIVDAWAISEQGILTQCESIVLEVFLLTGQNAGKKVFIPGIRLEPTDAQVPFRLYHQQFPVLALH